MGRRAEPREESPDEPGLVEPGPSPAVAEPPVPRVIRACAIVGVDPDDLVVYRAHADGGCQLELPGGVTRTLTAERLAAES